MYKKTEKKINFLLDKLLRVTLENNPLYISSQNYEIYDVLKANKELLPVNIQEKIIHVLPVTHSWDLLSALQSKNYQHLNCKVVKLLDLNAPFFSYKIIETLYKMGTYQYVDEIRPFAVLNNPSFKGINYVANKYIKRAGKLKEKIERKGF